LRNFVEIIYIENKISNEDDSLSQLARNDPRRILFEKSIDPKSLKDIKNGSEAWIEGITVIKSFR